MKNKLIFWIIALLTIGFISACDSMESEVDVPATDPKLVVYSYISPDQDSVKVWVTQSVPLYTTHPYFSDQYPPITDATVTISDGTQTFPLQFSAAIGQYFTTDFQPQSGATYSLEVITPRNQKATAQCTVPNTAIPVIEFISIEQDPTETQLRALTFGIQDAAGNGNYYRVSAAIYYHYEGMSEAYFNKIYFDKGEEFISDINNNGGVFIYKTGWIYPGAPTDKLEISVFITDENYFNYHRTINTYQDENPFSEPTPVYSNINGGLGVFAAYRNSITEIDLRYYP